MPSPSPTSPGVFLAFIIAVALVCGGLIVARLGDLKSENELDSMVSRESGFLYNNLLFLAACFSVLWGTLFPVLSEAIQGERVSVGAPFFNKVNVPIGLVLLALTGIGPLLAWKKTSLESLKRHFTFPSVAALVTGGMLFAAGMRHAYALICFALCSFVTATIIQEFHQGARARRTHRGGSYLSALVDLTMVNTRRYGGYIVHFGMVLLFLGVGGSAFDIDKKVDLNPGESFPIRSYDVTLKGIDDGSTPNYHYLTAQLELKQGDRVIGTFEPQRHLYIASQQPTSEVRRFATFKEDVYMVFAGMTEAGKATIQVYVNPLVRWVWIGAIVIFLGTCITMVPNKRELKVVRQERSKAAKAAKEATRYEVA